jgi:hypothetical protein
MNENMHNFFISDVAERYFNEVIPLHETSCFEWETLSRKAPLLPRGWFELAHLALEDRIEFTQEYWQSKLPFECASADVEKGICAFFERLEDIGFFLTQEKKGSVFTPHMVYSFKNGTGFFQGGPPASAATKEILLKRFGKINFPIDYLAFLEIHDGFSKYTDTGIIKSRDMAQVYQRLQHLLSEEVLIGAGRVIDQENLIPFYESTILHCYQCFYSDWYPEIDMGNIYFSAHDRSISNYHDYRFEENLAFPTFLGWLKFYLEDIYQPNEF